MRLTKTTTMTIALSVGMLAGIANASLDEPREASPKPVAQATTTISTTTEAPPHASTKTSKAQNESVKQVQSSVDSETATQASKIRQKAQEDAVDALAQTEKALRALDSDDAQAALDSLGIAIGKFETLLAVSPDMALVPLGATQTTIDIVATKDEIKDVIKEVQRLIRRNEIQAARKRLDTLASESVITETGLPLATFPDALVQAVRLIREEKNDQAKALLTDTLNTLVVVKHVVPLPTLRAQLMIEDADVLARKSDRTKEESEKLDKLIEDAREQIQIAELLGYGSHADYKNIYKELDKVKEKTRNNKHGEGFFKKITQDLTEIRKKIFK